MFLHGAHYLDISSEYFLCNIAIIFPMGKPLSSSKAFNANGSLSCLHSFIYTGLERLPEGLSLSASLLPLPPTMQSGRMKLTKTFSARSRDGKEAADPPVTTSIENCSFCSVVNAQRDKEK